MLGNNRYRVSLLLKSRLGCNSLLFTRAQQVSKNHRQIQSKWQSIWQENKIPTASKLEDTTREKFYCLVQFPYPSGNLHMGHARVYYITDTIGKFESLKGKNVFVPMGWDAFGLPAENAALERNIQPSVWTKGNISECKKSLNDLGVEYDWDNELSTCDPSYYKWTQWIFTQMFKHNIAYKKSGIVNWDPVDQTVLANEQIDENGRSWRSGAIVEKKNLDQWCFAITEYAKKLSQDLEGLDDWPHTVKEMQRGWIGYSEGANVTFSLYDNVNGKPIEKGVEVFTTRVDTILGCTFLAMSYEHPLATEFATESEKEEIMEKLQEFAKMDEVTKKKMGKSKKGLRLSNIVAINPLNQRQIPVYLTNYVLPGYGTGAIMGVPAHDERDQEFAESHNIESIEVLELKGDRNSPKREYVLKNSGQFDGLTVKEATKRIVELLVKEKKGKVATNYSIRDWLISRQRYWGVPIPMIKCDSCGWVPEKDENLPLLLPESLKNLEDLRHISPLSKIKEFVETECPCCKKKSVREFDTMDTFVDSSWYFMRYLDPKNEKEFCRKDLLERWLPVDVYIGGIEHAIMHLLYARFFHKFLYDIGAVPKWSEPFKQLITQGLVKGKTYRLKKNGKYLFPHERGDYSQEEMTIDFEKMSKSKGNGVQPTEILEKYGADCLRISLFFSGPIEKDINWEEGFLKTIVLFVIGLSNLKDGVLERLYQASNRVIEEARKANIPTGITLRDYIESLNKPENQQKREFLTKMLDILEKFENAMARKERDLHVASARLMESINLLNENREELSNLAFEALLGLRLLLINTFPLAPFITSELWETVQSLKISQDLEQAGYFGNTGKLLRDQLLISPKEFLSLLKKDEEDCEMTVVVNGKAKGTIRVPLDILDKQDALLSFINQRQIEGVKKEVIKVIVPKGKGLLSLVTK